MLAIPVAAALPQRKFRRQADDHLMTLGKWQLLQPGAREPMSAADHRRVVHELDVLSRQIVELMHQFEGTGLNVLMKEDYVQLHALHNRVIEQRREHTAAIGGAVLPGDIPTGRH